MDREAYLAAKRGDTKRRRANAVAAGKCACCCKRPAQPGMTKCEPCLSRAKRRADVRERHYPHDMHVSTVDRFCVACQAHGWHRDGCRR